MVKYIRMIKYGADVIEKEYKAIIDKSLYEKLAFKDWDEKFTQINFYYANETILNSKKITIRIRSKKSRFYLQIKVKIDEDNNILICKEYEQEISTIPNNLTISQIREVWEDYDFGNLNLQGFLITERAIKKVRDLEIVLDRNSYNGIVDYELEIEYQNQQTEVYQVLDEMKIRGNLAKAEGKYTRFIESLKRK